MAKKLVENNSDNSDPLHKTIVVIMSYLNNLIPLCKWLFTDADPYSKLAAVLSLINIIAFIIGIIFIPSTSKLTWSLSYLVFSVIILLILTIPHYLRRSTNDSYIPPPVSASSPDSISAIFYTRNDAIPDMKESILAANSSLFIAGIALSTVQSIISDDDIIRSLAHKLQTINSFTAMFVTINPDSPEFFIRDSEITGRDLSTRIENSENRFRTLKARILFYLKEYNVSLDVMSRINFLNYFGMMARCFILKADNTIYVGPYFATIEGLQSYILKLDASAQQTKSLYAMYDREISILKQNMESNSIPRLEHNDRVH
jgi:hypothetical protein